ncbi:UUP1 family membrane protein [Desulfoluna spongiiphila]|uniref:Inactive transglutaminase fused to 7 transmembrane helices n=1 Tax=Desulfoluna spongiiphila TaxID=419481 RepID=A0A1G5E7Z2_9BACT|nr:UUP1 family membrane protein [Desulfoluna spongiiphila]SCY23096.1 Inactive transglutaminase fused to 7 transmembrane helices [Desulfoluna spongiiphila]VVS91646.1 7 transmembrane helices usually fused to an inactive transglutaminase [Desulfoluna spongiiphila]
MKQRIQIITIIVVLIALGAGAAAYKHIKLGFPFLPEQKETVWTVEATITFTAQGGPAEVSVNMPKTDALSTIGRQSVTEGYTFKREGNQGIWTTDKAKGNQKIFFRTTAYRHTKGEKLKPGGTMETTPPLSLAGTQQTAATHIVAAAKKTEDEPVDMANTIISALNDPVNDDAVLLLSHAEEHGGKYILASGLINMAGVKARKVKGLKLSEGKKKQTLKGYIEILDGNRLKLMNPRSGELENRDEFLLWRYGNDAILDITGGSGGKITFATLARAVSAQTAAVRHGQFDRNMLIDFSIYSLPVSQQNTFKLLLLIPIGALIVVILRNLVGIQTSGTFMPILIAMVFLEVNLLAGLALFVLIVGIGLVLRSYLSSLNLLLVPRISAVLVFVIIIYVAISVISIKMGFEAGLMVTFFPMIIISWTIERMSVLWEEEGPRDVLIQGGGSLFSASLIFLAMQSKLVGHLAYSFPELLLVVLAVIIMIGSYSGYRLTELRRFEPLAGGR